MKVHKEPEDHVRDANREQLLQFLNSGYDWSVWLDGQIDRWLFAISIITFWHFIIISTLTIVDVSFYTIPIPLDFFRLFRDQLASTLFTLHAYVLR